MIRDNVRMVQLLQQTNLKKDISSENELSMGGDRLLEEYLAGTSETVQRRFSSPQIDL